MVTVRLGLYRGLLSLDQEARGCVRRRYSITAKPSLDAALYRAFVYLLPCIVYLARVTMGRLLSEKAGKKRRCLPEQ